MTKSYYYSIYYNKIKNDFYGMVEDYSGVVIYEIIDLDHIKQLIKSGVMKHIDDSVSLEQHLKKINILNEFDRLSFTGLIDNVYPNA